MIETFLDHVLRQSYPGRITVVVVDDNGRHDGANVSSTYATMARRLGVTTSTSSSSQR